ncbi:MAG: hypothetical protein WC310_02210 [Patescibacteria group bacterium]|jgi:hypothetical protein
MARQRLIPDDSNYMGLVGTNTSPLKRIGRVQPDGPTVLVSERQFEQDRFSDDSDDMPEWDTEDITETDPSAIGKPSPILALPVRKMTKPE